MKKFKNNFEYSLVLIVGKLIRILPLSAALAVAKGIGLMFFYLIPIRKKVATENLVNAFPDKSLQEINQIVKNTYINLARNMIEFMRTPLHTKSFLESHVHFENPEILDQAYTQNKGGLCLTGHFGNWELMGAAISAKGYPMTGLAKDQRNKKVGNLIIEYRKKTNVGTIPMGMGVRGVLKALKDKKLVAIASDQDAHSKGVFIDFLGRPSSTAPGVAILALKSGAPIIYGTCVRSAKGHHTVHLELIDHSDLDGVTEENIEILTQRHASALEKSVRKWPDHWLWMHKRWKTKPPVETISEPVNGS